MSAHELRSQHDVAYARLVELQREYEEMQARLEPQIAELSGTADRLAVEFKQLVREAAEAYASGQKQLAGVLASQRRAKQAECEALNARANELRRELARELDGIKAQRAVVRELASQLKAARGERYPLPSRRGGWYSKYSSKSDTTELMISPDGDITESYPHVHVVHDGEKNQIRIIASRGPNDHPFSLMLDGDASAAEVDRAVERALTRL